jgi:hypothetical protein
VSESPSPSESRSARSEASIDFSFYAYLSAARDMWEPTRLQPVLQRGRGVNIGGVLARYLWEGGNGDRKDATEWWRFDLERL